MTFTYLFFQKIRLLNSQGVFPLKLLKKISGSFYRCLIFKVRRTWVSPQRGSLLYHAVGCLSRGFFKLFSLLPKSSLLFVSLSCVSRRVPRYNTKFNPSCQPLFFTFFEEIFRFQNVGGDFVLRRIYSVDKLRSLDNLNKTGKSNIILKIEGMLL